MYYDVFNYPLTFDELYAHQGKGFLQQEFKAELDAMVSEGQLQLREGFYLSPLAADGIIGKRRAGNSFAQQTMPAAIKWSRIVYRFPFVRSVNLSGSLSKNYFDEHSDIDYFIVTKANRLWICRTLLILFWKMLPAGKKKRICTNYFVDETVLEMEEKNRFTATELSYLIPVINAGACRRILQSNAWVSGYINNKPFTSTYEVQPRRSPLKGFSELLLDNALGNRLENFLLRKTIVRWRKKYPDLADQDFELQFRSRKNVCKRHTKGFQNKVLESLSERIAGYEKHLGLRLEPVTL